MARGVVAAGLFLALVLALAGSLLVGASSVKPSEIFQALSQSDWHGNAMNTVLYIRMPRGVLAALVGASLAVAGAVMQLVTRNPLASPQTLGVNATASLAMVFTIVFGMNLGIGGPIPAFVGAFIGGISVTIFSITTRRGPVVLALAGMAIHLLCTALIQAMAVLNQRAVDVVFWMNGSVAGAQWKNVTQAAPLLLLGLLAAFVFARPIQTLGLGREVAAGLGQNYIRTMVASTLLVTVLAGASVAVAGPIGFVGLISPHVIHNLVGRAPLWEFPLCALGGALLLVTADVGARVVMWPTETPVGVLTALIGAPVFLILARTAGRRKA